MRIDSRASGCGPSGSRCDPAFPAAISALTWSRRSAQAATARSSASGYAAGTQITKGHLDSFISASAREPFTARMVIDTGDEWGPNAKKTIEPLKPACAVLRFGDLAERRVDWPDLASQDPEKLRVRREVFDLRPHQRAALGDVMAGFRTSDRGKLIMACGTGKTFTALRDCRADGWRG